MSRLDSLRLYHDPNEGLRTGGTDQNTALSVQRILVLTHLLPQAFIAHNTLLGPAHGGYRHINELLGVLGAAGYQLGRRDSRLAVGLDKLQSRQLAVAGSSKLPEDRVA